MTTGDSFYGIVNSLSHRYTIDFQCIENPTYEDYHLNDNKTRGCGKPEAAMAIFSTFVVTVILIFLNLFIAIIVQGYEETVERNSN